MHRCTRVGLREFLYLVVFLSVTADVGRAQGGLPLFFAPAPQNEDGFVVRGGDKSVHFGAGAVGYSLWGFADETWRPARLEFGRSEPTRWNVRMEFLGARPVAPIGEVASGTIVSRFQGPREEWRTGQATYRSIRYEQLWPGIDLVYEADGRRLKYHFVVRPGADTSAIRLAYRGAQTSVTAAGMLRVETPVGGFEDEAPTAFQAGGEAVEVAFDANRLSDAGVRTVGFTVGAYDRERELIIDPAVVVYSGFLGGVAMDAAYDVAVDETGAAFVTGFTMSDEGSFPTAVGPDLSRDQARDAFVAKLSPDGASLVYAGYLGGAGDDAGLSIAVDATGAAYVAGTTMSPEASFPVAVGPDLTFNGQEDAFIAKVSPDGTDLVFSGYLGGAGIDEVAGVAIDAAGAAYVIGTTASGDGSFPATVGPALVHGGESDAFIAKVAADGTGLIYAGFLGGADVDRGLGLAVGADGAAYLTGETASSEATFPGVVGPGLSYGGRTDAFVAKVAADGAALVYAGYLGGANADSGRGIAIDADGAAYVVGKTASGEDTFPTAVGPDLEFNGREDAFLAKVAADGSALEAAGYLGGNGMDSAEDVALSASGMVAITGYTASFDFPVAHALDDSFGGLTDAFVAATTPDGAALIFSTYLGGTAADAGRGVATDESGDVYVAGEAMSAESDFPVVVGPDLTANGASDAFVTRLRTGVPFFTSEGVINGASFAAGPIAPGQIISLFGTALAASGADGVPPEGLGAVIGEDGKIATERGGTKVLFDGEEAPLYFVSERQINLQTPYTIDGQETTSVVVMTPDGTSAAVSLDVASTAPGLFTTAPGEAGVVAVLPDGAVNSAARPAAAGDMLMLFATGEGQTVPPGEAGLPATEPFPVPAAPVELTVGGVPAELLYAGAAPGFSGLMQVNAIVPEGAAAAALTAEDAQQNAPTAGVILRVGDGVSQAAELFLAEPTAGPGPVANDDEASTDEDVAVTVAVLANDTHPDGLAFEIVETSTPPRGDVTINPGGTITFTPRPDFNGLTAFSYTVEDTDGNRASANVRVRIGDVNDPPNAFDDTAATIEDTPVTIAVLANDRDQEDAAPTLSSVGAAAGGEAVANGDGTVTFSPADDFTGVARFSYTIADSEGLTDTAQVAVTVTDDGTLPIANADEAETPENTEVAVPVLLNDVNNEEGPLVVQSTSTPANGGAVVINLDGTVSYTPAEGFLGTDTFTYVIADADNPNSEETGTGTVTVFVRPVTDMTIAKTLLSSAFVAGTEVDYQITVGNNGPSDATDATVTDTLPEGLTFVAVGSSAGCTAAGQLVTCGPFDVAVGGAAMFTVRVRIASSLTGVATNTAFVDQANDSASPKSAATMTEVEFESNLSIIKSNGQDGLVSGTQTTYTILVSNAGPSDVVGATVTDTFPVALENVTWTCSATAGSTCASGPTAGDIAEPVSVAAGGSVTFVAQGTVASGATGTLENTATVAAPAGVTDPDEGDNSATDSDALTQESDIQVANTLTSPLIAGQPALYTIAVTNAGPSDASSVLVSQTFTPAVVAVTWICQAQAGSSCFTATASGLINMEDVSIAAGSTVTYSVTATVNPAATGTLNHTATATNAVETNPADNTASRDDAVGLDVALAVSKALGPGEQLVLGETADYVVTVTHAGGTSNANNVRVTDLLDERFSYVDAGSSPGCSAIGRLVTCDSAVPIPPGGMATFTIQVRVDE